MGSNKADSNLQKHGVPFDEAATAFRDPDVAAEFKTRKAVNDALRAQLKKPGASLWRRQKDGVTLFPMAFGDITALQFDEVGGGTVRISQMPQDLALTLLRYVG